MLLDFLSFATWSLVTTNCGFLGSGCVVVVGDGGIGKGSEDTSIFSLFLSIFSRNHLLTHAKHNTLGTSQMKYFYELFSRTQGGYSVLKGNRSVTVTVTVPSSVSH